MPRSLIKVTPRKLQHTLKFGCDVDIVNKKVKVLDAGNGFLFNINKRRGLKPNRVTKSYKVLDLKLNGNGHNITFIYLDSTAQPVYIPLDLEFSNYNLIAADAPINYGSVYNLNTNKE